MTRVIAVVVLAALVAACETLRLPEYALSGVDDEVAISIGPEITIDWVYDAGAGFGANPLLVSGARILVATRQGDLHAVAIDGGRRSGRESVGRAIEGGVVQVGRDVVVPLSGREGGMVVYDLARGRTVWRARGAPVETAPIVDEQRVIWADLQGRVHARDRQSGIEMWRHDGSAAVLAGPINLGDDIAVPFSDGLLIRLSHGGHVTASIDIGAPIHADIVHDGRMLYVPTTRGRTVVVDPVSWEMVADLDSAGPDVRLTSPALINDDIVIAGTDGRVVRIDVSTGASIWTSHLGPAIVAPPLIIGSHVLVGTSNGRLVVLDATDGTVLSEIRLRGRIRSGMISGSFGIVVASEPRYVYRIVSAPPSSEGQAPTTDSL